ncbi:MAG: ABC transporter permease subunit [bacterium]|nr:ABC transporter permease subunit [bacterium]
MRVLPIPTLPMNALVQRDLVRQLRRVRPFLALAAVLGVLGFVVFESWPSEYAHYSQLVGFSGEFLGIWSLVLLVSLVLFMPSFGATAICAEREERTYDMLSLTLISPLGFLMGKLCVLLGFYAALLAGCVPLLATAFFATGLDWSSFVMDIGVIAAAAFACAAFSLLASTLAREASSAVRLGFIGALWVMGFPVAAASGFAAALGARSLGWLVQGALPTLAPGWFVRMSMDGTVGFGDFVIATGYHIGTGVVVLLLAWWRLGRAVEPPVPDDGEKRPRNLQQRLKRIVLGGYPPQSPMPDRGNPVYALECRYGAVTRGPARKRMFGAALLLALVVGNSVYISGFMYGTEAILFAMGFTFFMLCVLAPAVVSNSITKERERDNLDALRSTVLTPRTIVWGKAMAGMRLLLVMMAACFLSMVVAAVLSSSISQNGTFIIQGFVSLTVCCFLAVAASLLASCRVTRTPAAVSVSLLLGWGLLIGAPIVGLFLYRNLASGLGPGWATSNPWFARTMEAGLMWSSPVIAYFKDVFDKGRYGSLFWATNVLAFTGLGVLLLWNASRTLNARFRRDA